MVLLSALVLASAITQPRDSYPAPSPDGRELVFVSNRTGKTGLWRSDIAGSNPKLLFDGGSMGSDPTTPAWSPDGRSITFAMTPAGATDPNESEIYRMDADGTSIVRLTSAPGDDSHPHWSADGTRIFFNSARATPNLSADWSQQWIDVYSMAADGSDVRRHTECRAVCTYPSPSPDGKWIVYRRVVPEPGYNWALSPSATNSEIFVAAMDGSKPTNLSRSPAFDGWPMWAPNGWIVFASNRDRRAYTGQIFAVRPDGTGVKPVTEGALSRAQPIPSADGRQIFVYESVEDADGEFGHVAKFPLYLPPLP